MSSNHEKNELFVSFKKFCDRELVSSSGIYEIYGSNDFILKFWIKTDQMAVFSESFISWADNIGKNMHVKSYDIFDVDAMHHHWLWQNGSEEVKVNLENFKLLVESIDSSEIEGNSNYNELVNRNILKSKVQPEIGIRFLTTISTPSATIPIDAKNRFVAQLVHILKSSDKVMDAELYSGRGEGNWFLLDARVDLKNYDQIYDLIHDINETGLRDFGCYTTTYLCATTENSCHEVDLISESTSDANAFDDIQILELLEQDESVNLEIKGSLRIDVKEFLSTGTIQKKSNLEEKALKTIVGFLNTNGGVFVIGAIEPKRFSDIDISNLPEVGKYKICGVDPNLLTNGIDTFERTITQRVRQMIGSGVSPLIRFKSIEFQEKLICAIIVPKLNKGLQYYNNDDAIIREGSITRSMTAKEVAIYVKADGA